MFMTKDELTKGYTFGNSLTLVIKITETNPQTMVKLHISTLSDIQNHSSISKPDLIPFLSSPSFSIPLSSISYQCQLKDTDSVDHLLIHLSSILPLIYQSECNNNSENNVNNDKNKINQNDVGGDIIKSCSSFLSKDNINCNNEKENKKGVVRRWELRQNNTLRPSKPLSSDIRLFLSFIYYFLPLII